MAAAPKSTHVGGAEGPTDAAAIVKDLIITALLALAIFGPIVGLKTVTASGTLALQQRWGEVAVFVAITVAGRLCIHLYQMMKPKAAAAAPAKAASAKPEFAIGKYLGPIMLVIAIALPFIASTTGDRERQIMDLAILILTYIMLGWGLNIVVGLAGLLDLGYVAFYAVGAYTYALLSTIYFPMWFGEGIIPWAFFITLPIAGILAALWGVILGFPVLRLRGDYLAIVTLAFGEIIRVVLHQLGGLHRRPRRHRPDPATLLLRPPLHRRRGWICGLLRSRTQADLSHHLPLLHHPCRSRCSPTS